MIGETPRGARDTMWGGEHAGRLLAVRKTASSVYRKSKSPPSRRKREKGGAPGLNRKFKIPTLVAKGAARMGHPEHRLDTKPKLNGSGRGARST